MTRVSAIDLIRQFLNVAFALGQIVASFVPELTGVGRRLGDGEPSVAVNPAAPPGPAFSIWGVLFPAVLAYAVYQAAPLRAGSPLLRRVGWLTAVALALTTAWVLWSVLAGIPRSGDVTFAAAVLACYLAALGRAEGPVSKEKFVTIPVSLMAGWLTVALGVNVSALLVLPPVELLPQPVAVAVVASAGAAGVIVPRLVGGKGWYSLPVAWGLAWVAAGNLSSDGSTVVAVAAAVAATFVLVASVSLRRPLAREAARRPRP
jgi:hypothetical protein